MYWAANMCELYEEAGNSLIDEQLKRGQACKGEKAQQFALRQSLGQQESVCFCVCPST
jgi:hypothetical protein